MRASGWYQILFWAAAALPLLLIHPAQAADGGHPLPLALDQAVHEALQNNPEITAARRQFDTAGHQVVEARSALLPQVFVSESYTRTDSP